MCDQVHPSVVLPLG